MRNVGAQEFKNDSRSCVALLPRLNFISPKGARSHLTMSWSTARIVTPVAIRWSQFLPIRRGPRGLDLPCGDINCKSVNDGEHMVGKGA